MSNALSRKVPWLCLEAITRVLTVKCVVTGSQITSDTGQRYAVLESWLLDLGSDNCPWSPFSLKSDLCVSVDALLCEFGGPAPIIPPLHSEGTMASVLSPLAII